MPPSAGLHLQKLYLRLLCFISGVEAHNATPPSTTSAPSFPGILSDSANSNSKEHKACIKCHRQEDTCAALRVDIRALRRSCVPIALVSAAAECCRTSEGTFA
ncbi:hypothetical protein C8F01DRAFT_1087561 [Mycena amicta]|nr:hypothetical protein C8F01DRAFT_1087561 [Mycena amicta]